MVKLITGRSGSGKTGKLFEYIRSNSGQGRAVLIVPEQSSFYNEKRILDELGERDAADIEVLSFRRLCSRIFEEYKGIAEERIDDGVKAVLMSMAIENAPAEGGGQELYGAEPGKKRRISDLVEPMLVAVNEYKLCMITPEMLMRTAKSVGGGVLAAKLRDSARIYAAYNALLENTYADPDDDLTRLYDILGEHDYFSGMRVYIDSFSGFSAQELKITERIMTQCKELYITVCCDRESLGINDSVFYEPALTYRSLIRCASRTGVKCIVEEMPGTGLRFRSGNIRAIEENIFSSYRAALSGAGSVSSDGSVRLYEASDIYDEVRHIAVSIFRMVRDEGYRYNEIEIIGRQPDLYKSIIAGEFPKYDIPFFISDPVPLEQKPLIRMMLSVFEAVHSGFDTEAVIRLAKTGMTSLKEEEVFRLENYCYVWNIRGKRWREPFTMSPEGIRTNDAEQSRDTQLTEDIRKRLIEPLTEFESGIRGAKTGSEICERLYALMEEYGTRDKFRSLIHRLSESCSETALSREASVWDIAIDILEKLHHVMTDKPVDSRSFESLLRLYIRKRPISDIPETINSVSVGQAGTVRSRAPRAVFVIGAAEGVFPAQPGAVGIFTDSERRILREGQPEELNLPLYDSIYGASLKEKMNVYTTLCAPSERLYVSFYRQSPSGAPCEPSVIVHEIKKIIPDVPVDEPEDISSYSPSDDSLVCTERQCFDVCAQLWNTDSPRSETLKSYYLSSEKYSDRAKAIKRASRREAFSLKNKENARRLFGAPLRLSSTKIDKFSGCKFSYFCCFGLDAQPLRKASMDSGLYGTAMHYIFEKLLRDTGIDELIKKDETQLKMLIAQALDCCLDELGDKGERSSRFNAVCRKIRRNAFRVLLRMCRQFEGDSFRPEDFELHIGGRDEENNIPAYEIILPTGDRVVVSGFVDRVDTALIDGKKYIRIIDYKTGQEPFELGNIANGIKLQMLLYLSAILKNGTDKYGDGQKLLPAGVLYVPATSRSTAGASSLPQTADMKLAEQENNFRMKGLLIKDKNVLSYMEQGPEGKFIPAAISKKPPYDLNSRSSVVTDEEFDEIFRYIDICIKRMGVELYSGNISAAPSKNACKYCPYASVCRFEKGSRTVKFPKYDKNAALDHIREELRKEENENDG